MKYRVILFFLVMLITGCGPKKGIVTKKDKRNTKTEEVVVKKEEPKTGEEEKEPAKVTKPSSKKSATEIYIETYSNIAKEEMRKYKIPASITLAQGILESGSGKGRLAKQANNHFGIKCHGWKGKKIYHDDDRSQECFRKYKKASSSYKDHSKFLTNRGRYSKLFKLKQDDYKGWAKGLKAAGYATDRRYPQKLISLIERYKLYEYDREVLGGKFKPIKVENETVITEHTVIKGDTLYSLAKRYNLSVEQLKSLNKLTSNDLKIGQILIVNSDQ